MPHSHPGMGKTTPAGRMLLRGAFEGGHSTVVPIQLYPIEWDRDFPEAPKRSSSLQALNQGQAAMAGQGAGCFAGRCRQGREAAVLQAEAGKRCLRLLQVRDALDAFCGLQETPVAPWGELWDGLSLEDAPKLPLESFTLTDHCSPR